MMGMAGNVLLLIIAAAIVWVALQWVGARAASSTMPGAGRGSRADLSLYTPPQHAPCEECSGVGGLGELGGVRLCPLCDGTGITAYS